VTSQPQPDGYDPGRPDSSDPGTAEVKDFYRRLASGVAVVTSSGSTGATGMTASSVVAVSLAPALLLVSLTNRSSTLAAIRESRRFAVNLLARDQEHLATRFASGRPGWVKFGGIPLRNPTPTPRPVDAGTMDADPPVLGGALATVVCDVGWVRMAGDHTLVLGEIAATVQGSGDPLIWYESGYHGLGLGR